MNVLFLGQVEGCCESSSAWSGELREHGEHKVVELAVQPAGDCHDA